MNNYIPYESYAAVDLGSNSFHMIVANYNDGHLQVIDKLREPIRLASGLDHNNFLTEESMARAVQCLERFGQRIREMHRTNVRAVGTNTLRKARNGARFLARAAEALGHPIEIISGLEEARLIYQGVVHTVYESQDSRLVIDIGGGSTELILGRDFQPTAMESLYMGCVSISKEFFSDGVITAKRIRNAMLLARQELEAIEASYIKTGWDSAIGSSGSILSIREVVKAQGWCDDGISTASLEKLRSALVELGNVDKIDFPGINEDRKPVFTGGVTILSAVFEALKIDRIITSDGALREGLLYDMIGRLQDEDIRDNAVREMARRYSIDVEQADRISATASHLYENVKDDWGLTDKQDLKLLQWAAAIHEIGMAITHAQYHRHGAYLVSHSNLPGFSNQEQLNLAMLIRSHRRKFPQTELINIPEQDRTVVSRLCILFRLAVLLNRSRFYASLPTIKVAAKSNELKLTFPDDWLSDHPLTQADLETEATYLKDINFKLLFK